MDRERSIKASRNPPTCRMAVVKIASRCNLNCSYCYMYNLGDRTALEQPKVMPDAIIDATIGRCMEHAAARGLDRFRFVFHGGEPLMAGPEKFERLIRGAETTGKRVGVLAYFALQTNGMLLTDDWCRRFVQWGVSVGVSLDGPKHVNDRNRINHAGEGSYDKVMEGWERAQAHGLRPGILIVIDPESSASEAYRHLLSLQPSSVDFLLPDANHSRAPAGAKTGTPYADWLLEVFHLWNAEPERTMRVRLFEQIIAATLGLSYANDAMGDDENEIVVIETDGEIGPVDTLRAAIPGAGRTGFNVARDSVETAMDHPLLRHYHGAHSELCQTCAACPINRICGGGYLSHRYSADRGFDNPSVYCRDLTKLIAAIRQSVLELLPQSALTEGDISPWTAEDVAEARAEAVAAIRAATTG